MHIFVNRKQIDIYLYDIYRYITLYINNKDNGLTVEVGGKYLLQVTQDKIFC